MPVRANGIDMPLVELVESARNDCRRARRRAHRHGREPAGRHQVARDLRSAGRRASCTLRTASSRSWSSRATSSGSSTTWGASMPTLVYNGLWFSQTREAIDAFVAAIQPRVTGTVRLKLFKGDCRVVGRRSDVRALRSGAGDLRRRRSSSITRPPKASSRSGACRPKPPRAKRRPRQRRWGADRWRISGPAGSPAIPTPRSSTSARRSDSIGVCSKTMWRGAWRGPRRSSRQAC